MNPFSHLHSPALDFDSSEGDYYPLSTEALLALDDEKGGAGGPLMERFLRDNRELMREAGLLQAARTVDSQPQVTVPATLPPQPSLHRHLPSQTTLHSEGGVRGVKQRVRDACTAAEIRLFDCSLAAPCKQTDLSSSPLGPCPPFLLLSQSSEFPSNPDFRLLSKLVIGHFLLPSRASTKLLLKRYAAVEAENHRKSAQRMQRLTAVSVVSAVTLGLWAVLRK